MTQAHVADLCPDGVNIALSPSLAPLRIWVGVRRLFFSGLFQTKTHLQEPNCHHIYFSSSCFSWPGVLGSDGMWTQGTPDVLWNDAEASIFSLWTDGVFCRSPTRCSQGCLRAWVRRKAPMETKEGRNAWLQWSGGDDLFLTGPIMMQKWSCWKPAPLASLLINLCASLWMTQAGNLTEAHSLRLYFKGIVPTKCTLKAARRWGLILPKHIPVPGPTGNAEGCFLVQSQRMYIKVKRREGWEARGQIWSSGSPVVWRPMAAAAQPL